MRLLQKLDFRDNQCRGLLFGLTRPLYTLQQGSSHTYAVIATKDGFVPLDQSEQRSYLKHGLHAGRCARHAKLSSVFSFELKHCAICVGRLAAGT